MTEEDSVSDSQLLEEISSRKVEVDKLLARKDKAAALSLSLQNPPVASKNAEVKVSNPWQKYQSFQFIFAYLGG